MKKKTSITLSKEVLRDVDRCAGSAHSRSSYIEHVLRRHFRRRARAQEQARDVERLNAAADRLNTEMADVLQFQTAWSDDEERDAAR